MSLLLQNVGSILLDRTLTATVNRHLVTCLTKPLKLFAIYDILLNNLPAINRSVSPAPSTLHITPPADEERFLAPEIESQLIWLQFH